jgi:hypothetical protein
VLGTHTHGNAEEVADDEEPPGDSNYALFSFSGAEKFCPSVRNFAPTPQGCKIAQDSRLAGWANGRLVGRPTYKGIMAECHARSDAPDQRTGPPHSSSKIGGLSLRRAGEAHSSFERVLYSNYYHYAVIGLNVC